MSSPRRNGKDGGGPDGGGGEISQGGNPGGSVGGGGEISEGGRPGGGGGGGGDDGDTGQVTGGGPDAEALVREASSSVMSLMSIAVGQTEAVVLVLVAVPVSK